MAAEDCDTSEEDKEKDEDMGSQAAFPTGSGLGGNADVKGPQHLSMCQACAVVHEYVLGLLKIPLMYYGHRMVTFIILH